jgi:hypothetical protein
VKYKILSKQGVTYQYEGDPEKLSETVSLDGIPDPESGEISAVWAEVSYLGRPWRLRGSEIAAIEMGEGIDVDRQVNL